METAYKAGVNTFDTAEVYSGGKCEEEMGRVIKELGWQRESLVVITKLFFGAGLRKDPNQKVSRNRLDLSFSALTPSSTFAGPLPQAHHRGHEGVTC